MKKIRLYDIAHSRTGDKGDHNTLSLIPYDIKDYLILKEYVTAEAVKEHMKELIKGDVTRYELNNIHALSFFCEHSLSGGVTTSLAADIHGKSYSSALLNMEIEIPEVTKSEEYWETRDHVKLRTVILRPETDKKTVPCIVQRTPYAQLFEYMLPEAEHFCRKGYAYVIQLCRGIGGSEGEWVPYIHEKEDGLDLLAHLEQADWYGPIALTGSSYMSMTGWIVGGGLTPKVRTAFLCNLGLDRQFSAYSNGMFRHDILTGWCMDNAGFPAKGSYEESCRHWPMITVDTDVWGGKVEWYREYLSHPAASDPYWEEGFWGECRGLAQQVRFPSLCFIEGWFDHHLGSALHSYEWLNEETKAHTQLVIGPWDHGFFPAAPGKNIQKTKDLDIRCLMEDWFERTLMKEEQPESAIRFYEIGTEKWRTLPAYPVRADKQVLHFSVTEKGEKTLMQEAGEGTVSFVYDPKDPVPTCGGESNLTSGAQKGSLKQPPRDYRKDVLSFVSEPLSEDLPILGPITVHLRVASTAKDTAFCAKFCEEKSDGSAWNLRTVITSLSCREETGYHADYTPGDFVDLALCSWDIAWNLEKGSRIRIDISSSDFPQYAAHPNREGLWCMVSDPIPATQTLDCSNCYVEISTSSYQEASIR